MNLEPECEAWLRGIAATDRERAKAMYRALREGMKMAEAQRAKAQQRVAQDDSGNWRRYPDPDIVERVGHMTHDTKEAQLPPSDRGDAWEATEGQAEDDRAS